MISSQYIKELFAKTSFCINYSYTSSMHNEENTMLTIDFYKYKPNLHDAVLEGYFKNVFKEDFDHSVDKPENQCSIYHAEAMARDWLKNNYGKVVIQSDEGDYFKLCNKQKMLKELTELGFEFKLLEETNHEQFNKETKK